MFHPIENCYETSFVQGNGDGSNPTGRKGWLWVVATPLVSYFAVFLSRSQAVAGQLLGEAFKGIVNSDRFSAYNWLEVGQRQICWAHLKRDFTQMAERSGISSELGNALLQQEQLLFEYWWRKNSFGSQSLAGSLFVARMLTVVTSLRAQNRPVLDYLIHACRAARQGKPAPSLLPADSSTP
jgi:hypothetical protein